MASAQIYIGPRMKGVAHGTVFNNGIPEALKEAITATPAIRELIVPVNGLAAANNELADADSALSRFYKIAEESVKNAKKGE